MFHFYLQLSPKPSCVLLTPTLYPLGRFAVSYLLQWNDSSAGVGDDNSAEVGGDNGHMQKLTAAPIVLLPAWS